ASDQRAAGADDGGVGRAAAADGVGRSAAVGVDAAPDAPALLAGVGGDEGAGAGGAALAGGGCGGGQGDGGARGAALGVGDREGQRVVARGQGLGKRRGIAEDVVASGGVPVRAVVIEGLGRRAVDGGEVGDG